jgi:hypothetical protein
MVFRSSSSPTLHFFQVPVLAIPYKDNTKLLKKKVPRIILDAFAEHA